MATREEDIQKLIEGVIETSPEFFDNPNGGYENTCPFCDARGGGLHLGMLDLKHNPKDCIWLIAMDLNTK